MSMTKIAVVLGALALFVVTALAATHASPAAPPSGATIEKAPLMAETPCFRTEFKTELAKKACAAGGQKAAVKAMKAFTKAAKGKDVGVKNCKSCHSKFKPEFPLTKGALELFKKAGGK